MNKVIELTPQPVTLTSGMSFPQTQPMFDAVDLLGVDLIDFQFGVIGSTGTQTTTFNFNVLQGNQVEVDDASWILSPNLGGFTAGTTYPAFIQLSGAFGLLRYFRWSVSGLNGLTSLTFVFRGVGRARGG